jgi:antirestriction protein
MAQNQSRDMKFKSNEKHERYYVRKTKPKNPRYKLEDGGVMAKGGMMRGTKKMPEWSVTITSEDGNTYDWVGYANNEDDALYKAEKKAGFESVETGINMLTDEYGNKIEYADGGVMAKGGGVGRIVMIPTYVVKEIVDSVKMGYDNLVEGMIGRKRRGVMLINKDYQVRGTYDINLKDEIQSIIDKVKSGNFKIDAIDKKMVDGGVMAKGGGISNWVVEFNSNKGNRTIVIRVMATSQSDAIDKAFRELSERGEDSDDYSVSYSHKSKYADGGVMAKGGNVKYSEDIAETKRLITAFIKKYGHVLPMNEQNFIDRVEPQEYLGHGASSYNSYKVTSNISDKLKVGQTKPRIANLWLSSDINPSGVSGKDDIARTYNIHLEIKGKKRLTLRSYDNDGIYFKIWDYGRTIAEVLGKVEEKMSSLEKEIRTEYLRFEEMYADGGKVESIEEEIRSINVRLNSLQDINTEDAYNQSESLRNRKAYLQAKLLHIKDTYADDDMKVVRTQFEEEEYEYAKGGIFGSDKNLSRDRMFKSKQKWEQKYKRKTSPKNPRYKFADGGATKMYSDTPKVYVADLGAYNEGKLIGEWLDLSEYSSGSEVMDAITELLQKFSEKQGIVREEYAIHDIENIPRELYSEYMGESDFDKVIKAYEISEDRGISMEAIASIIREYEPDDLEEFVNDRYEGQYDSDTDLAYAYVDNIGGVSALGEGTLQTYFDYEAFGRDLANDYNEYDGYYFRSYARGGVIKKYDLAKYTKQPNKAKKTYYTKKTTKK